MPATACDGQAAEEVAASHTTVDEGAMEEGARLYLGRCASCHGMLGKGDGLMGQTLDAPNISDAQRLGLSDPDIHRQIRHGGARMPPVPDLTDAQIAAVVTHVRRLQSI